MRALAAAAVFAIAATGVADAQRGGGFGGGLGGGRGGGAGRGAPVPGEGRGRQGQDEPPPTFRSAVTLVQIDAIVTDASGKPVTGLTASDFELREGGQARDITAFAEVDIPAPAVAPARVGVEPDSLTNQTPPGRTYLIALDEMAPDRALRARTVLHRFIEQYFGPSDVAAVALIGRGLASSGQDFTSNKRLLLAAVDKFSGGFPSEDADPTHPATSDARQLASGLRALTEFLAKMPGRKVMLYVGEGLAGLDPYATVDYHGTSLSPGEMDAHEAMAAATRGNVTIYPIDPRGATTDTTAAESFDTTNIEARSDMSALAAITGGFALTNSNGFANAFDRMVRENSTYYTIGFGSEYAKRDGRFVKVDVRVTRPGLRVRSRDGYVAPLGRERSVPSLASDARNPTVAAAVGNPVAVKDVPMRVAAASYRAKGKNASVALVIEFDVSKVDLVEKNGQLSGEVEVTYLATDATGKVRPGRRHDVTITVKKSAVEEAFRSGARVVSDFELPRGRYQLRVAAGGAARAGSVLYDLEVPDFGSAPLTLSSVSLTTSAARTPLTLRLRDPLAAALPGPPVAIRDFSTQEVLSAYVEVYENAARAGAPASVTMDLRAADGTVVRTAGDQKTSEAIGAGGGRGLMSAIPLANLAPGAYVVHVEARGDAVREPVTREIPIRVR